MLTPPFRADALTESVDLSRAQLSAALGFDGGDGGFGRCEGGGALNHATGSLTIISVYPRIRHPLKLF